MGKRIEILFLFFLRFLFFSFLSLDQKLRGEYLSSVVFDEDTVIRSR